MRSIDRIFDAISGKRVLVIGDTMLDHYLHGNVHRMSPEAPVPVITHQFEDFRLGGAANVALNLDGLGLKAEIMSTVGLDSRGTLLKELAQEQLSANHLLPIEGRVTTTKTRVVDQNQQLLRIDQEMLQPIPGEITEKLFDAVTRIIDEADTISALVLSDYNKGLLTPDFTRQLVALAIERNVKVLVDPKGRDFEKYRGATLITPNIAELEAVAGTSCTDEATLKSTACAMREQLELETLIVTMGSQGLLMVQPNERKRFPALTQEVFDVSGAGDTVLAAITAGIIAGLPMEDILDFANLCAAEVIKKRGTTPISMEMLTATTHKAKSTTHGLLTLEDIPHLREQWMRQDKRVVFTNGCFDLLHPGHIELLEFAKSHGDVLIVGLNSDTSVKRLKGEERPITNERDRAVILKALSAVDHVILFEQDTPIDLINEIRPHVLVKGADYANRVVVGQAEVENWGGEVKLCPLSGGYSTTSKLDELSNRAAIETFQHPK